MTAKIRPQWAIMPFVNNWEMTRQAAEDVLAQTLPEVRLLLIDQGSGREDWDPIKRFLIQERERVCYWHHSPPLLSLAATWNAALRFVWQAGGDQAWVLNNDVRLHPRTYETLLLVQQRETAWFVSGVGVTDEQFQAARTSAGEIYYSAEQRGGPDFSCFVLTEDCHQQFPFDERFIPAYCEDLDYHRTLMLAGHRDRIFGVNLPFLHYASGTLKSMNGEDRARKEEQIGAGSRAYYRRKWGGDPNQETFLRPHDAESWSQHASTPELQHAQLIHRK